jgi:hypothetical protein
MVYTLYAKYYDGRITSVKDTNLSKLKSFRNKINEGLIAGYEIAFIMDSNMLYVK